MPRTTWTRMVIGLAVAALVTAGCSDNESKDVGAALSSGGEESKRRAVPLSGEASVQDQVDVNASASAGAAASGASGSGARAPLDPSRQLILTAELSVRVRDLAVALDRTEQIALSAAGEIASETSHFGKTRTATVVVRVPPDRFRATLDDLGKLGTLTNQSAETSDVTDEVVDLDGRLRTAEASANRLRALIDRAGNPTEIVALENELTRRETEIESMRGRQRVISDQVSLASITARLSQLPAGAEADDSEADAGFSSGLRAGWRVLRGAAIGAATAAGAAIPLLPLLIVIVGALWTVRRLRPERPPTAPTPTPTPTPTT